MSSLKNATADFEIEVEELAAEYIRDGIALPWEAIEKARSRVLRRRAERSAGEALNHFAQVAQGRTD